MPVAPTQFLPVALPLTGGSLCGVVRCEVTQQPLTLDACHCTRCQRIPNVDAGAARRVPAAVGHATGAL